MTGLQTFIWTAEATENGLFKITLPFDPKTVFGKARAPLVVTINGYRYRSTVAHMGGPPFIPFRKSHREAAGVDAPGQYEVTLCLDEDERRVEMPADLAVALDDIPGATEIWNALSYTSQREHLTAIEGAKRPETRQRRIERALTEVAARQS